MCGTFRPQEKIQTFLFSATMPKWIKDLCQRFLKKDHKTVDLIGDTNVQVRPARVMQSERLYECISPPFPLL